MKILGLSLVALTIAGGAAFLWARDWCERHGWTIDL